MGTVRRNNMETIMKFVILAILLLATGCVSKTLVKNCSKVENGDYFVCDKVYYK